MKDFSSGVCVVLYSSYNLNLQWRGGEVSEDIDIVEFTEIRGYHHVRYWVPPVKGKYLQVPGDDTGKIPRNIQWFDRK